jgi:CRP-like cAMP-binding protein
MQQVRVVVAESFSSGAILANLSYTLLIIAMLMTKVTYLRILAVCSGCTGFTYLWVFLGDRVASFWELLFISTNLFQLILTAYRNHMSRFGPDETFFRYSCVPRLSASDARRLLRIGRLVEASAGAVLTREREPVGELVFILAGDVEVRVGDRRVGVCGKGDFIGEIGVMNGGPATATAATITPVRYFSFEAGPLKRLMARNHAIAQELELACRQGLREKLVRANTALVEQAANVPA